MWWAHSNELGAWGWVLMTLTMAAFWGLVARAVVMLARALGNREGERPGGRLEDPEEILDRRLARGEIDEGEPCAHPRDAAGAAHRDGRHVRGTGARRLPGRRLLAVAASVLALMAIVGGCGSDDAAEGGDSVDADGPGFAHVHGLGFDGSTGDILVATHHGLHRVGNGRAARVGERTWDLMGFTVDSERLLASGHPSPGEGRPPHLGLVESRDGGETWQDVSLSGEADFHALGVAGERLYGWDSTGGRLMRSDDGGAGWTTLDPPGEVIDLAVDPSDPDHVLMSGPGGLHASRDGGRSWSELGGPAALVAWTPAELYRVVADGRVGASGDGGRSWSERGSIGAAPAALAADEETVVAASGDAEIHRSDDGGRTWEVVVASPE